MPDRWKDLLDVYEEWDETLREGDLVEIKPGYTGGGSYGRIVGFDDGRYSPVQWRGVFIEWEFMDVEIQQREDGPTRLPALRRIPPLDVLERDMDNA